MNSNDPSSPPMSPYPYLRTGPVTKDIPTQPNAPPRHFPHLETPHSPPHIPSRHSPPPPYTCNDSHLLSTLFKSPASAVTQVLSSSARHIPPHPYSMLPEQPLPQFSLRHKRSHKPCTSLITIINASHHTTPPQAHTSDPRPRDCEELERVFP